MKKLLITDLDDTLYNWLDFFIPAFREMVDKLVDITGINKEQIMIEYKEKHQFYGSVEYPFVTLKLPCILDKYKGKTQNYIQGELQEAFHRFNSVRKEKLVLFSGVEETLKILQEKGIVIIGYTESSQENGYYRLKKLGIDKYFKYVYSSKSTYNISIYNEKVKILESKKPDARTLIEICNQEGIDRESVVYIGDSLTKDIYMAVLAGVTSVWANYEKEANDYYQTLVEISSWTEDDFRRERELKTLWENGNYKPDYEIKHFKELLDIFE